MNGIPIVRVENFLYLLTIAMSIQFGIAVTANDFIFMNSLMLMREPSV